MGRRNPHLVVVESRARFQFWGNREMAWFSRKPKDQHLQVRDCGIGLNKFDFEIVGESSYQDALHRVRASASKKDSRGYAVATVVLRREPSNRYDANAIEVIHPNHGRIGYVPKDEADRLRPYFEGLRNAGLGGAACDAVLLGGGRDRPSIGAFLSFRPINEDDTLWGDKLSGDASLDLPLVRRQLSAETNPIDRHYLFLDLERLLYRSRDTFASSLDEFDAACREHDAEMGGIRQALVAKCGFVPDLATYKQAAIRHQKAGDLEQVIRWTQRGIDLYGDLALEPEWPQDLVKRRDNAAAKLQKGTTKIK